MRMTCIIYGTIHIPYLTKPAFKYTRSPKDALSEHERVKDALQQTSALPSGLPQAYTHFKLSIYSPRHPGGGSAGPEGRRNAKTIRPHREVAD